MGLTGETCNDSSLAVSNVNTSTRRSKSIVTNFQTLLSNFINILILLNNYRIVQNFDGGKV